ncbi:MAG: hypothetical protein HWQ36_18345 [Nostoc sp. NMS2]|uniref:hypothetical protein n=1 Tax=Nostoc sp. NMS2 TaxID=2815389 RepID=UPI0025E3EE09|nr:hypothetical protein [Nostoc sp. NMS2]MBN3992427.1 hypothetical protein [Nostoc sp. NMS2]
MFKGFGRPKKKSVLEENELTTGIVQHPVTGLWQTWISFTGHDIQCVTAHANRDDADRVAKQIADAWSEGKYKTQQEVTAFIQSLPTDAVIDPLPQNIVMQLSKQALSAKK